MRRAYISVLSAISALAMIMPASPKAAAETPKPIQWTLSATTGTTLPLRKGATVVAHLHANIQSGWHLYALDQEPGGPTATRINVSDGQPFALNGNIDQPVPMSAIDPNFNLETHFYQDEVTFTIPLKVVATVKSKPPAVSVDVLYQTCNDTMCLPPTVAHLTSEVKR